MNTRQNLKQLEISIPCQAACPIQTDIPGYIEAIIKGDYAEAYRINRQDNVFPGVLGRVCHRPCEPACRHGRDGLGDPVQICFLKRSASDFGQQSFLPPITPRDERICIIGAGPAGLTAANDLALLGFKITVLEQWSEPGGMMMHGIPNFRLPKNIVENDIQSIRDLGVDIQTSITIDNQDQLEDLQREYQAVIFAGGCMLPARVEIPGQDLNGFYWGLDYVIQTTHDMLHHDPGDVVVVGGGFTAVDCCRAAFRLGAKSVTLVYRRQQEQLRVGPQEVHALQTENIKMEFLASPISISGEQNVSGIQFIRNTLDGRGLARPISGTEFDIPADTVIFATGQSAEPFPGPELLAPLFIAGDYKNGSGTIIEACTDGRNVAQQVKEHFSGQPMVPTVEIQEIERDALPRGPEHDERPTEIMNELALENRTPGQAEVELGFNEKQALLEGQRCYLCHYQFEIDESRCIYCLKCIEARPVNCISLTREQRVLTDGTVHFEPAVRPDQVSGILIDNDACIRCACCVDACPTDCIHITKRRLVFDISDERQ